MPRFDLDTQRGLVCLFGLVALTAEGIGYYVTGRTLPDIFTGGFFTMALGPLASAWAEQYQETRRRLKERLEEESKEGRGKRSKRESE